MKISHLFTIFLFVKISHQDIYLHNPRGSNNRLNENSANRANGARVFNSQNNNKGGYNIGDLTDKPFTTEDEQYQMKYLQSSAIESSFLKLEWTEQHGCGGNENTDPTKQNCLLVLQYMCQPISDFQNNNLDRIRDGLTTDTQTYTTMTIDTFDGNNARKNNSVNLNRVLQETWDSYDKCYYRERNKGLFTADQILKSNEKGYSGAIFTRQNPNGNRNGYECPEERDYYPYWHPSAWKDIAVLTSNISVCSYYVGESFNVKSKYHCVELYAQGGQQKHWSKWNNQNDCLNNGGKWIEFYNYLEKAKNYQDQNTCESNTNSNIVYKWAVPYDSLDVNKKECLILLSAPKCQQAAWSRSNHLGNTKEGESSGFEWKLPYFPSKKLQKCVFRIRYNITTDDYEPFTTDSTFNNAKSPIKNNPLVDIGANKQVLQLAINTAQYGRVFQDRSHSFYLLPRPKSLQDNIKIFNLNVRGKRGNIVQTYPAVEYDFIPNKIKITTNDILHIQWTGSNTHNNANPAGDGQAGDDGQGNTGTDRNNLVQVNNLNENFPLPYESTSIWKNVDLVGFLNENITNFVDDTSKYLLDKNDFKSNDLAKDLALYFSTGSYFQCVKQTTCSKNFQSSNKALLDPDLNNAPASMSGALIRFTKANQIFYYICSRNNNFSNRSQKGSISVVNEA